MRRRDPGEGALGMLESLAEVRRLLAESPWLREMLVVCPHQTLGRMKRLDAASRQELRRQLEVGELLPAPSPVIKRRSRLAIRAHIAKAPGFFVDNAVNAPATVLRPIRHLDAMDRSDLSMLPRALLHRDLLGIVHSERGGRARAHASAATQAFVDVPVRDDSPKVLRVPVSLLTPSLELAAPPPGIFGHQETRKGPAGDEEEGNEDARAVRIGQLTGGVVPKTSDRGWWDLEDFDFDPYYGRQTRTRSVELANIARTDLGVPLQVGDGKMLLFFGDTWDHDLDRNPGFFDSGDPYGWTDANLDVFLTAPKIRWVVTSEPTYDQRGRRVSGPGYVPLLRGVLSDRELGGACGPLGAFYDPARDTAYVFFVAQVTMIPPDPPSPAKRDPNLPPREDWCPAGDECVRLDRTVVAAARGVTRSLTDPPSVPQWEVVAQHTAASLKAVAPVLVSREEIEPSWSRDDALTSFGVTARDRAITDAPHHTRVTPRSARLPPGTDPVVLMFGSDKRYRFSKLVLARCPLGELDPRATNPGAAVVASSVVDVANAPPSRRFQYLQWVDYSGGPPGVPFWTEDESLAMPLVDNHAFGQPHVVREPRTGLWLMTDEAGYAGNPGIALRWAPMPWGPWGNTTAVNPYTGAKERLVVDHEPALTLFEGDRDHAHGNFIHRKLVYKRDEYGNVEGKPPSLTRPIDPCLSVAPASPRNQRTYVREEAGTAGPWPSSTAVTYDDGLSDAPFGDFAGAGFGAYLVAPWFRHRQSDGGLVIDIVYTLSTANPWQVQLLSTSVRVRSLPLQDMQSKPWAHHERVT